MSDLMNTRMMKFLNSFLITNHADAIFEDAYLSNIGRFMELLYTGHRNNDTEKYFKKCLNSLNIVYEKNKEF